MLMDCARARQFGMLYPLFLLTSMQSWTYLLPRYARCRECRMVGVTGWSQANR